eukprot:scaffold100768_cov61-Phaeocystis_antarctica.AAC.11
MPPWALQLLPVPRDSHPSKTCTRMPASASVPCASHTVGLAGIPYGLRRKRACNCSRLPYRAVGVRGGGGRGGGGGVGSPGGGGGPGGAGGRGCATTHAKVRPSARPDPAQCCRSAVQSQSSAMLAFEQKPANRSGGAGGGGGVGSGGEGGGGGGGGGDGSEDGRTSAGGGAAALRGMGGSGGFEPLLAAPNARSSWFSASRASARSQGVSATAMSTERHRKAPGWRRESAWVASFSSVLSRTWPLERGQCFRSTAWHASSSGIGVAAKPALALAGRGRASAASWRAGARGVWRAEDVVTRCFNSPPLADEIRLHKIYVRVTDSVLISKGNSVTLDHSRSSCEVNDL